MNRFQIGLAALLGIVAACALAALPPRAAAQDVAQLQAELDRARALIQAQQAHIAKFEAELAASRQTLAKHQAEMDELRKAFAQRDQAMAKQVEQSRAEIKQLQAQLDQRLKQMVQLQDLLAAKGGDAAAAAKLKAVIDSQSGTDKPKINPPPDPPGSQPPQVDGVVTAVTAGGLIEISLGSDDGLKTGHRLEVYRLTEGQGIYCGRIEVLKTTPDRSACKVIPEFERRPMQKGDRVASKL